MIVKIRIENLMALSSDDVKLKMKKRSLKLLIFPPNTRTPTDRTPYEFTLHPLFDFVVPGDTTSIRKESILTIILKKANKIEWKRITVGEENEPI